MIKQKKKNQIYVLAVTGDKAQIGATKNGYQETASIIRIMGNMIQNVLQLINKVVQKRHGNIEELYKATERMNYM